MNYLKNVPILAIALIVTHWSLATAKDHLVFEPAEGSAAKGKHIVLLAGDEEYRSEESMPMLGQILAREGFKATVLFSMDRNNQFVDPINQQSISNPAALDTADAIIMGLRFRNYPDSSMDKFVAAFERGVPIIALRTSTHAFKIPANRKYAHYSFNSNKKWKGGFGKHVLGETWVSHHGRHMVEGTRTFKEKKYAKHPILTSVGTIFAKSDVYGAYPKKPAIVLLRGGVTKSLNPNSPLLSGKKNTPMMPVVWLRKFNQANGKSNRIITSTMGSADDLKDENLRRLIINATYWGLKLPVPKKVNVTPVSPYNPLFYGFGTQRKNQTPADFIRLLSPEQAKAEKLKNLKGKAGNVRYIRIELPGTRRILTLAEVEAISGGQNIALKGKAKQSSTAYGLVADNAIDGNNSPKFSSKSQTHTKEHPKNNQPSNDKSHPWWEVDLQGNYDVSEVKIWNRNESNLEKRLEGFTIILLDESRKKLFSKKNIFAPKSAVSISIENKGKLSYNKGTVSGIVPSNIIDGPKHPTTLKGKAPTTLNLVKNARIGLIGGGLGSRMNLFNEFETELQRRYPSHDLYIRNFCFEGNTPAFRPHPSRNSHWVLGSLPDRGKSLVKKEYQHGGGKGHYETPDAWLTRHSIDTIIGFFGYSESFDGASQENLDRYKKELKAFITHTLKQKYTQNGAQLAIVGPAAFEDLSAKHDLPDGKTANLNLQAFSKAMQEVCAEEGILFISAFDLTKALYDSNSEFLTSNGHNLNAKGYKQFSPILATQLFGQAEAKGDYAKTKAAVAEKNRLWIMDYKMPNSVHNTGRRYEPYGNVNYPHEFKKVRQMTAIRDKAIWAINKGQSFDVAAADKNTHKLPLVKTNSNRPVDYKSGKEVEKMLKMAPGYKVELFACEKDFPELANPSQMAFDNKGRLWVSCMPSYPHYKIGDPLPTDRILIFEDTNNDGKADKVKTFVNNIHIPMGFEITEHGVFVSLGTDLVLLKDTDGDDKADVRQVVLSGFDDHDTHHAISSFCADPSGAIYMGEGIFSHSNVETPYGPVRGTNGGFYRYNPNKNHLERTAQYHIPNPWGIAFDHWGQNFFLHTSGTAFSWMQQGAIRPFYNVNLHAPDLIQTHKVRPTSGLEVVSSRHFPNEVQGDIILCNNIGFLGAKQHSLTAGKDGFFETKYRHDLFQSPGGYRYFRPVDLEFAPDGSLYFVDWSNVLIGHMQHSARDPKRDHVHGRIYRVTYPKRKLVKPAKIHGASITQLLENLKLPEIRTRYRTRRELRGRDQAKVLKATQQWVKKLNKSSKNYNHNLLEALWVTWGINKIDINILEKTLNSKDYRARTAAVRAVRYNRDKLPKYKDYLMAAAADKHPQVRHEAIIQASWLSKSEGEALLKEAAKQPISAWSKQAYDQAVKNFQGVTEIKEHKALPKGKIAENEREQIIQINCVEEALSFDVKEVQASKGKKIKLRFTNPDVMQHNILIVKPGTADTIATAAMGLGVDGMKLHWIPKSSDVLAASKLLNLNEKETLEFTLDKPGKYPFICSFPGHATMMRGHIIVK